MASKTRFSVATHAWYSTRIRERIVVGVIFFLVFSIRNDFPIRFDVRVFLPLTALDRCAETLAWTDSPPSPSTSSYLRQS